MDLKEPGNLLLLLGETRLELGGSLWADVQKQSGGRVPRVDPAVGRACFRGLHAAIARGLVRSCHDLSEGGLAVGLSEIAIAGGLGARVALAGVPCSNEAASDFVLLFSESPSRFVLEVEPKCYGELAEVLHGLPLGRLGEVSSLRAEPNPDSPRLTLVGLDGNVVIDAELYDLKEAWQRPLRWS
jgi:phosphoribosylformylglycinamidine synthase